MNNIIKDASRNNIKIDCLAAADKNNIIIDGTPINKYIAVNFNIWTGVPIIII